MAKHEEINSVFGLNASKGIVIGTAYVRKLNQETIVSRTMISTDKIEEEMAKLKKAQDMVAEELELVREKIEKNLGASYSDIISAQLAILKDQEVFREVQAYIEEHHVNIAFAYKVAGKKVAVGTMLGLFFLANLHLWEPTIETLVLVLIATSVAVIVGIPLGILAAIYDGANRVIMPLLDLMQTMPAFVYLIPAIPFFGLGPVAAIFSTVIFAMPPAIRLTSLGIRQVPADLVEAADAYGCDRRQKLTKLQLPLALPTIMAGINQTIMLALSMVVIASMIGAGGLGGEVWKAIQRLQPGKGFEAGIGIVILAMILDRLTNKLGRSKSVN